MYLMQILKGIGYLHENNKFHGNLKTSNILIDSQAIVKISDYAHFKLYFEYIKNNALL